jgi:hypothetical protein
MPYKSKAARERAHYLTFVEAVGHVCAVDQCDSESAVAQLLSAIIDNEVQPIWADAREFETSPAGRESLGQRWIRAVFWSRERISLENGGMALDDGINTPDEVRKEAVAAGIIGYRPFLLKRADVLRIWPKTSVSKSQQDRGVRPLGPDTPSNKGRPTTRDLIRNTLSLMHEEGVSLNRVQMALATEIVQRNGKQFNAPGWSERTVLKHVSDWLKDSGISPARSASLLK